VTDPSPAAAMVKKVSLVTFLETTPPDSEERVDPLAASDYQGHLVLDPADIRLYCDSEECEGKGKLRFVKSSSADYLTRKEIKQLFMTYLCRNCRKTNKTFALVAVLDGAGTSGAALKVGEIPPFGPEVPARVITLIGPDRELFLKGRRAENRGLGIGAFAYYRRVVENQKGRIIEEMAKVAKKLGASQADLKQFELAAKEIQFATAIDKINAAIPPTLRIDGHNPLTLLHGALSDGLHERSDEDCLEYAMEIRVVLTELAERMSQALKEEAELKGAVSKLLERAAKKRLALTTEASEATSDPKAKSG
jgi:hypothetical protein